MFSFLDWSDRPAPPKKTSVHTSSLHCFPILHSSSSILLVNVPVAFLLLPVLENHGDAHYEKHVNSDDTESGCENEIEIYIGK